MPLDVKAALAAVEANGSLGGAATLSSRRMPSSRAQLRLNAATKAAGKVDGTLGKVQGVIDALQLAAIEVRTYLVLT